MRLKHLLSVFLTLLTLSVGQMWGTAATLPVNYSFGDGKSSLPTGVSQSGLGDNYAAGNAPYRLKFDNNNDYIQIEVDAAAETITIGIKEFSTSGASIQIQGCATSNGTYSTIQTLSFSQGQNKSSSKSTSNSISSSYRYFRVKRNSGGNFGLGTLAITKAASTYTITAQSNNTSYGTVSLDGDVITGSPKSGYRYASPAYSVSPANSATVSQSGNAFTVNPSANTTVTINFEVIPSRTINYSIGGTPGSTTALEGTTIVNALPANPSSCDDENYPTFYGWKAGQITGVAESAPTILSSEVVTSSTPSTTYYAVFTDATSTDLFSWDGGSSSSFTALDEVTASGLGSDYAAGNSPYLIKLDGTGDYIIIEVASKPSKVSIDIKMIGGGSTSSITVQESADNSNNSYSDVEVLDISGSQNDELTLETSNSFKSTTRYIKLYFTKGSNVGVGPISIEGASSEANYITTCCQTLGSINGSISWTQTTATVTWDKKADVGNWAVTYKTDAGSETSTNVTITSPDPDASHKRAVITGLTPNTHYTIYVKATNATGYCETAKTWDYNGTTNAPYTITYKDKGNVNFSGTHESGYPTTHVYGTATTLKSATKTGYDFSGWFTAQDCSGSAITEVSSSQNANITLYAKWTAHQHTLTWNFNEGGTSSSSYTTGGTKDYGSTITYPANNTMSKVGYTFANWTSSPSGNPTTMPDADLTITANWTANANTAYTVKHYKQKLDGTYDATPDETDNLAGTTAASVTPARKSYDGFTAPAGQLVTILADGSLVVEYQYTRNSYTLTWTTDGNALTGEYTSGSVKFGAAITAPNTPTKDNFSFNGWTPAVAATMPAENTEYTATWIANAHKVTYDPNGATSGDVPASPTEYNHGTKADVLGNTGELAKTHYTFGGWSYGGNTYNAEDQVTVNENVTLSAVWNCAESVTVSKGEESHGTFTVSTGAIATCDGAVAVNVTSITPAPGYQFSAVTATSGSVENTTVTFAQYANGSSEINVTFTAKHITVTWNVNGGNALDDETSEYIYDGDGVTPPTPTRTGYDFAGWYTEAEGGTKITEIGTTNKPSANVEYYAHWNVKSYDVTWMVAGNEWSGKGGQSSVAYGSHIETLPTAPNPKAEPQEGCGDKFMGWTDAANGAYVHDTSNLYTTADDFPNATGAQTFYAVFADYTK